MDSRDQIELPSTEGSDGRRPLSGLAMASFICGTAAFVPLAGIAALALGVMARRRLRQQRGEVWGAGFATAGILLGAFGTALMVFAIIAGLVFLPGYRQEVEARKESLVRSNMKEVQSAIEEYRLWTGGACPLRWHDVDARGKKFVELLSDDLVNPFSGEIGSERFIDFEAWPPPEGYSEMRIGAGEIIIYGDRDRYMVVGGGVDGAPLVYVLSGGP
jgi:hypothetical protein